MLQKGIIPCVARSCGERHSMLLGNTDVESAIGHGFHHDMFNEHPEGIAGVIPTILLFISAKFHHGMSENILVLWRLRLLTLTGFTISPVTLSNKPGACHLV
jgi:hypothetical protein